MPSYLRKSISWFFENKIGRNLCYLFLWSMSGSSVQAAAFPNNLPIIPALSDEGFMTKAASPLNLTKLAQAKPTETEGDPPQKEPIKSEPLRSEPREPVKLPPPPPEKKPLTSTSGTCSVGVLASVILKCPKIDDNRSANTRVETHNLAAGFEEIVIPNYCTAKVTLSPAPGSNGELPGKLTANWSYSYKRGRKTKEKNLFTGSGHYDSDAALKKGWGQKSGKSLKARTKKKAYSDIHKITATFKPERGESCSLEKSFPVTFTPKNIKKTRPEQQLAPFVRRHEGQVKEAIRRGKKPETSVRVGTKTHDLKRNAVTVPVGIFWNLDKGCCKIAGATPRIIQFARAGISGPNGNQGKPWTLDITTGQIEAAMKGRKKTPKKGLLFDPTYTNAPGKDALVESSKASGSKRMPGGIDVLQWDSPGMPQSLYDRLKAASLGQSTYRQQFLTFLVCRKNKRNAPMTTAAYYLDNALVSQIVVTTITWTFPGKGKEEKITYTTKNKACDVDTCPSLRAVLQANGLLERYSKPSETARGLKLLPEEEFKELNDSLDKWDTAPLGELKIP